jgi:hypothetical protein
MENAQWIDLADEIGMSTNNGGCCIFPNLCDADAATVFLTRKIKIQPMEHYSNGKFKNNN